MIKRVKLLMLAPLPPPYSGPEILTKTFLDGGMGNSFDLFFIKSNIRKANAEKGKFDFVGLRRFLFIVIKQIFVIITKHPRIIYLPLSQNKVGFLRDSVYIIIGKLFFCKLTAHLMGSNFRNFYNSSGFAYRFFIKTVLKCIDSLIVQSEQFKPQFIGLFNINKIAVLPSCIDFNLVYAAKKTSVKKNNHKVILYVGHLSYAKGFYDLINTVPLVVKEFPSVEYWFLGETIEKERNIIFSVGQDKINMSEVIRRDFSNYLKYLGTVDYRQAINTMKNSDIFTLPSYSEGFSMAILEAMACGLPVVVTNVGAAPDFITEGVNGYIVNPGDTKLLAEKIIFLLKNEDICRRMGEENQVCVRDKFTAEKIIHRAVDILSNNLSNP